jgi:hypothetical protein
MRMLDRNSAAYVPFFDPTSSSSASCFEESTAPSGNLASAMRNWFLIIENSAPVPPSREEAPPATNPARSQQG